MPSPTRLSTDVAPGFGRDFLTKNWWPVLRLAITQAIVVWYAANHRWVMCALFVLIGSLGSWDLLKRAAGVPVLPRKPPEQMTPREAFWLDPAAVFNRGRRDARAS